MNLTRVRSWQLIILAAAFLVPCAGQILQLALTRDDIWWTPRGTFIPLADGRDRVEVYVGDVLLQKVADDGRLQLVTRGSAAPVAASDIGVRLNNWDRVRAGKLPGLILASIVAGAAALVLVTGIVQLLQRRRVGPAR